MKKLLLVALTLFAILPELFSQVPQAVCYQALAKDELGNSIIEGTIGIQVAILKGGPNGSIEWIERHTKTTDAYGVFAIEVGKGQPFGGTQPNFANIDWGDGTYWLQIEFDPTGGTNYELLGSTQIISVPYALYAERSNTANHSTTSDYATNAGTADTALVAINVMGDDDSDPTNELQELVDQNGELFLQNPDGSVNGSGISFDDSDINEIQELVDQNGELFLQNPDGTTNGDGVSFDNSDTNELQNIIFQNDTLYLQAPDGSLSGGQSIEFPGNHDNDSMNEIQELVDQNGELFLQNSDGTTNGNGVSFDNSDTNELQNIIFQNDTLYLQAPDGSLSGGQSIEFPGNHDNDSMNEIQELVSQNGELFLQNPDGTTNGDGVSFDESNTNELQNIIFQNDTLYLQAPDGTLSGGQSIEFPGNHDNDSSNELQNIIFQNDTLYLQAPDGTLSGGQSIEFPGNHDNDSSNELQNIIFQNDTLYLQAPDGTLSGGQSIDFPGNHDNDSMNEIQNIVFQNDTLYLQAPDGSLNGAGLTVDTSNINELQELTYSAEDGTISISGGNTIQLHSDEVPFAAPGASADFPQGLSGEHIVEFQGTYQVPAGKTFWVTAANSTIEMTGVGQNGSFMHPTAPNMPVFKELTILNNCMCTGVLIDQSIHIEPVTMDFSITGSFVVPEGKTLFVKSGMRNDEIGWLVIDGNPMEFLRSNFTRGTRIITVPENSVIQPIPAQTNSVLTGFLIDKDF